MFRMPKSRLAVQASCTVMTLLSTTLAGTTCGLLLASFHHKLQTSQTLPFHVSEDIAHPGNVRLVLNIEYTD
eukprot:3916186-Amphidinium_carterae.1